MSTKRDIGGRLKKFGVLVGSLFTITLIAVVMGQLSTDTLALALGIFLGGVPMGALLVLVITIVFSHYRDRQAMPTPPQQQYLPPPYQQQYLPPPEYTLPQPPPQARDWEIIGRE